MKVRNLLNHTSGIPDYIHIFQKKWNKDLVVTNADVLEYFRKFKPGLKFKPKHDWEYSNAGYVFLSLLIEFLTDNSFSEFLTENIFHPIDMKNSRICDGLSSKNAIPNFALGKVFDFNKNSFEYPEGYTEYEYVTFLDGIQGDGAIKMSAPDLLRWNNELLELNFIGDELCNLMFTKSRIINKIEIDYGLGWFINNDTELGKIVYHGGSWPGYSTYNSIYLDQGISIISLCNQTKSIEAEQKIIQEVENIIFKNELSNGFS
nr:serine hydrolase domain-containing protein [Leptospira stimsonii]